MTIFDHEYIERRGRERRVHRFSLTFRTLSVPQMARRLEAAGFRIQAVLGDYPEGPFKPRARRLGLLPKKKRFPRTKNGFFFFFGLVFVAGGFPFPFFRAFWFRGVGARGSFGYADEVPLW